MTDTKTANTSSFWAVVHNSVDARINAMKPYREMRLPKDKNSLTGLIDGIRAITHPNLVSLNGKVPPSEHNMRLSLRILCNFVEVSPDKPEVSNDTKVLMRKNYQQTPDGFVNDTLSRIHESSNPLEVYDETIIVSQLNCIRELICDLFT